MSPLSSERLKTLGMMLALVATLWGGVKFISRAGLVVTTAQAQAVRIDALTARIDQHDKALAALSYMTCVSFAETHPASQVPTYCDAYTRAR